MLHTHLHLDVARTRQAGQAYTVFLRTLQSTGQKATLVCILEGLTGRSDTHGTAIGGHMDVERV